MRWVGRSSDDASPPLRSPLREAVAEDIVYVLFDFITNIYPVGVTETERALEEADLLRFSPRRVAMIGLSRFVDGPYEDSICMRNSQNAWQSVAVLVDI
jgi:hypothetical protein